MKVEIEEISSIKKRLNFEVPEKRVAVELASAYHNIKKKAKIKGFRPGKIPREIIERRYKQQIEDEAISKIINDTFLKTVEEHNIPVVSRPVIDAQELKRGEGFKYSAVVEVKPEPDIERYLDLEIEREALNVSDQDVEDNLRQFQNAHAVLKEVEENRPLKKGDYAFLDFKATLEGKPFKMERGKDLVLEIGSNSFIPGFDEKLVGLTKNSEKSVEITFPANYQKEDLRGKEINSHVKLKQIKEKVLPKLDDEFAKDFGDYNSMEGLKSKIREDLENRERARIKYSLKEQTIDKIIERNQFEIPPTMVDAKIQDMIESAKIKLKGQGMNLESLGGSLDKMRESYREPAKKEVRAGFILESIARKESIKVNDEEIEEELKEIANSLGQSLERVKEFYQKGSAVEELKSQLLKGKTVDFLIEKAKIINVDKPG
jgi:trigger factor